MRSGREAIAAGAALSLLGLLIVGPWAAQAGRTEMIAKQPGNELADFFAYRHVSVVHFDVPENVVSVDFKFTTKEQKTGGIGDCGTRDVTINLKSGSIPLVTPDGSRTKSSLLEDRRRHYTIEASSNGDEHIVKIVAPPSGDWYAIAYRSWYDPDNGKIKQQGLGASCETILDAELTVEYPDKIFLPNDSPSNEYTAELTSQADTAVMHFLVPRNIDESTLNIKSSCGENCSVAVHVTAGDIIRGYVVNATEDSLEFRASDDESVHYVTLRLLSGAGSTVLVSLVNGDDKSGELNEVRLTRKTLPDFFLFDYEHLPVNSSKAGPMNLTVNQLAVMRFKVGPVYDTGGTLSVGLRFDDDEKENKFKKAIVGCLSLGHYSPVSPMGNCERDGEVSAADIFVANQSTNAFVHVPYPEPGLWHLTVQVYCIDEPYRGLSSNTGDSELDDDPDDGPPAGVLSCACFEHCVKNASNCESCECARPCGGRIETSIASSPCIEGGCSDNGQCVKYMSGGFVFSACHCYGGYRGFDCIDDEYVLSRADVLARILMLTLSNLAFVGAIYVAIRRFYYTEAIVYAAVMFFSTFYHACEAGEEGHSFCLMKLSVLQFCDFYNALLSIWVTLVAMASVGRRATSFYHMLGVVVLALGAEMDRTALWVFLMPAVSGCALVIVSWALKCRKKGTLQYPARIYRLVFLPLGLIVVFVGLTCYAFLQTRRNYYIVHSVWHVCVAAGAVLLLPKREYMQ